MQLIQVQQQVNPTNVDPKHGNPSNTMPFHLYTNTPKREYTDLHANPQATTNTVTVDGKQQTQQMSQWYDSNKVE